MSLMNWRRRGGARNAKGPTPGPAPTKQTTPSTAEPLRAEATALVGAWRPAQRRLVIPATARLEKGQRVVVVVDQLGEATIPVTGVVAAACAPGGVCEIAADEDGQAAVERVLDYLKGSAAQPRPREPRYRVSLPAFVSFADGTAYMTAVSISRGGCGLAWTGPPPRDGSGLHVRLGSGQSAASFRGMVRWVRDGRRGLRVGIRFLAGQDANLAALLAERRQG